jgi:nicotinamide-nucleotide amidase
LLVYASALRLQRYFCPMNITVLTIGDEILIGQIVNTNAAWISAAVASIGGVVVEHVTCGDDDAVIIAALVRLSSISDAVLITGGLGPTHDDRTKDVLCKWYGDTLVEHEPTVHALEAMLARRGATLSDRNRGQALVPSKCVVIPNDLGTAPGMMFRHKKPLVVSMPGVPTEMKSMMANHVLPELRRRIEQQAMPTWEYRTLITTGITEAALADRLEPLDDIVGADTTLAFLPSTQGVRLRMGARALDAATRQQMLHANEHRIRARAGDGIVVASSDIPLSHEVVRRCREALHTIAVAESCTGGMLGAALTAIPGSSAVFIGGMLTYSNASKVALLGVRAQDLEEHGAVSEVVAKEMALGARNALDTTWGIGITGVAGPGGGTDDKPVGTVWIALAGPTEVVARRFVFGLDRQINRERSVAAALGMLLKELA